MHEQFAHHAYLEIGIRHAPELAGFQELRTNATNRLCFYHV
jgi:hypothetical protein